MDRSASSDPRALLDACLSSAGPVTVAFSGGADSTALLLVAAQSDAARSLGLRALHVHHGLHAQADTWAAHCERVCAQLKVPLMTERVSVDPRGRGIEAAARDARYAAFARRIDGGALLLSHHADDQAETVLLRLLRGASIDGVAAMRASRRLGSGVLLRPWLTLRRADILAWLAVTAPALSWLDDPANRDAKFDRSFIRHTLLPQIDARFPAARERLTRFAAHAREQQIEIDAWAARALAACRRPDPCCLDLDALAKLSPVIRRTALRQFAHERCGAMPGVHELDRIECEVIGARVDADPQLKFADHVFRRYRRTLYLLPRSALEPLVGETTWPAGASRIDFGPLTLRAVDEHGVEAPVPCPLTVRARRGGERIQLYPGGPHRELRDVFQERAIPPWQRARTPLLCHDDELLAAIGVAKAQRLARYWPNTETCVIKV